MAIDDKWDDVEEAFDRLGAYRVVKPTLVAMRKLVALIRCEPSLSEALPRISMATLFLSSTLKKNSICIAWKESTDYEIAIADELMNLSEVETVSEKEVIPALVERISHLI